MVRFWGLVIWKMWIGRARNPGAALTHHVAVEVFNIGGWLTHGDLVFEARVDFLAVVEHRLIPSRVRSEWARLRSEGLASIWALACQDSFHVGNAGVISVRFAPVALPTFATAQFERFFDCGLAFGACCHWVLEGSCIWWFCVVIRVPMLTLSSLRLLSSCLTLLLVSWEWLLGGSPVCWLEISNVEPTKIPCRAKGILAGLWVDLEVSWAMATGRQPASTCERAWGSCGGNRKDFMVGCTLLLLLFSRV